MTIDHVTWIVFPGYSTEPLAIFFHIIGRLAMPIFAFFIAEGYHYTHDRMKYMLRILMFSLVSHVPYMMASVVFQNYGWMSLIPFATGEGITRFLNQGSVLFAYFIGLVMLCVYNSEKFKHWQKAIIILLLCVLSFPCDWSCIASLVVLAIGDNRGKPLKQVLNSMFWILTYAIVYFFALDKLYGLLQLLVILAVPLLMLYNGKKSDNELINKIMKRFFYVYYPLHLLIIGILGLLI
ncbi:MAG: conjugal transfer protein TraX [Paludibacteraceae bacterium]|nr:conjugal transfer protein TraX [Paludibacteraceae bacterium]